jgi:hypothetical protein
MLEDVHFDSALAVAAARFEEIDWKYVERRIDAASGMQRDRMRRIDSKVRARLRRLC